jgi:hypothetical protein
MIVMVDAKDVHPVFYVGLFIFLLPLMSAFLPISLPQWLSGIGIVTIIAGAILTGMKK